MAETPQGSNNVGNALNWIEKLGGLIKNIGLQNVIMTIMVLFLVIVVGQAAFNPSGFIKRIEEVQIKQHTESVLKRIEADPEINAQMAALKAEISADRVIILETHNGGSNLTNLPFLYVDLTYCLPKKDMEWLEPEYKNIRLSRYPLAYHLYNEGYWSGPLEDMEVIDPELYLRIKKDGATYFGGVMIYGNDGVPCGLLCVEYTGSTENLVKGPIMKAVHKYSGILSPLLKNEK